MPRNAKAWKFKRALLQKENPCGAKTLWNIKFLYSLLSDATKTSEGKVIFNFGIMITSHENRELKWTVLPKRKTVLSKKVAPRSNNGIPTSLSALSLSVENDLSSKSSLLLESYSSMPSSSSASSASFLRCSLEHSRETDSPGRTFFW